MPSEMGEMHIYVGEKLEMPEEMDLEVQIRNAKDQ